MHSNSCAAGMVMAGLLVVGGAQVGCQSATIAMKENVFGIAKRDQLVARVEDARKSQEEAKTQFASALEEFRSLTGVGPSEMEGKYKKLKADYDRCESAAGTVRSRIDSVKTVGEKLFSEWKGEVAGMSDPSLKSANDQQMRSTRAQY